MHDYIITADGGSQGNHDRATESIGYGSFIIEVVEAGIRSQQYVRNFGAGVTNNEAEYRSQTEALKHLEGVIEAAGDDPKKYSVLIRTDCDLIIGHITMGWKVDMVKLGPEYANLQAAITKFKAVEFEKLAGDEMKAILGH